MRNKVKVGKFYKYEACGWDIFDAKTTLQNGDIVQVVNKFGCPPANTMGHCYVNKDGQFMGLVATGSLTAFKG